MRPLRILKQGAWYRIRSRINNREPLFRRSKALAVFERVFRETERRFVFTVCALRLEDDWLSFYIKPEEGTELPLIMKWMKQTFAQRYNRKAGRTGHIWGDRYWSQVVEGEPPAEEEDPKGNEGEAPGKRGQTSKHRGQTLYGDFNPPPLPRPIPAPSSPG
jgi:REP element-mobilizing transposase RayT